MIAQLVRTAVITASGSSYLIYSSCSPPHDFFYIFISIQTAHMETGNFNDNFFVGCGNNGPQGESVQPEKVLSQVLKLTLCLLWTAFRSNCKRLLLKISACPKS